MTTAARPSHVLLVSAALLLMAPTGRTQQASAPVEAEAPAPAPTRQDTAVLRKLRATKIGNVAFTEETGGELDVVRLLRTVSKVPILVTPEAKRVIVDEDLRLVVELRAPLALDHVLDLLVARSERLAWQVRSGVVMIATRDQVRGNAVLQVYDVRVQTFPRTEFLPPRIDGLPTGDAFGNGKPRGGGEGEEKVRQIEPDALVETVKMATGPEKWDVEGGGTIEWMESGYLLVQAPPALQHDVARVLRTLE